MRFGLQPLPIFEETIACCSHWQLVDHPLTLPLPWVLDAELSSGGLAAAPGGVTFGRPARDGCSGSRPYLAIVTLLALAVLGISVWGLVESIKETDDTVSSLWSIVDETEIKVIVGLSSKRMSGFQNLGSFAPERPKPRGWCRFGNWMPR